MLDKEIGLACGVTDVTVGNWRDFYGLKTLSVDDRRVLQGFPSFEAVTKDQMLAHLVSGKSLKQIADLHGVSVFPVKQKLKKFGLGVRQKWHYQGCDVLSDSLRRLLVGVLLGDGTVGYVEGGETSRFKVGHSHKQYTYLKSLHAKMGKWARPIKGSVSFKYGKKRFSYWFTTINHQEFRKLRKEFYRDDLYGTVPNDWLKAPPLEVFRTLHDESLAYWYFDDGALGTSDESVSLAVFFPLLDMDAVVEALRVGTGLHWRKKECSGHFYKVFLEAADKEAFFSRIVQYATQDMAYKFPEKWWKDIEGFCIIPDGISNLSEEILYHYPVTEWKKLEADDQKRWVNEVFTIYRATGFPFSKVLSKEETLATVLRLARHKEFVDDGHPFIRSIVGLSLCNGYMPHRFQVVVGGKSAWDTFHDDVAFKKVLWTQFRMAGSRWVGPKNIRGALSVYGGNRTPSNFRPSAVKALVDRFCLPSGVVWDPCAGFGGRLLGAVCSDMNVTYIGTEPSPQTVTGLERLWKSVSSSMGWQKDRVRLIQGVAEKDCPDPDSVDFVFTSPPYFDNERYVGGRQSYLYDTYVSWVESFLGPLVGNAYSCLRSGGFLAINIQDIKMNGKTLPLVEDLDGEVRKKGFKRFIRCWYPLSFFGGQRPDEPILIYWKPLESMDYEEPSWDFGVKNTTSGRHTVSIENAFLRKRSACSRCGIPLEGPTRQVRHCPSCKKELNAERAQTKRNSFREVHPIKGCRTFTCKQCGSSWETFELGNFSICPSCREKEALAKRSKICVYRNCGKSFVDNSLKNSMSYCCSECQRREKLFRSGKVTDESHFRVKGSPRVRTCMVCQGVFILESGEGNNNRCPVCRERARDKKCRKCGVGFRDGSLKNTVKFCPDCRKGP